MPSLNQDQEMLDIIACLLTDNIYEMLEKASYVLPTNIDYCSVWPDEVHMWSRVQFIPCFS